VSVERIRKLIQEGEGFTVEFKDCTNALSNAVFETVCAFSNRHRQPAAAQPAQARRGEEKRPLDRLLSIAFLFLLLI